jgi:putative transposase
MSRLEPLTGAAKSVYLALGINMAGEKELLGLLIVQTEGAKFRL